MIQTLLIILFIIVPIFLLLDKVTLGAGEVAMGQARDGQGLHLLSPRACPLTHHFHHSLSHSVCSCKVHLNPSPLTPGQSRWPSLAWPSREVGGGS